MKKKRKPVRKVPDRSKQIEYEYHLPVLLHKVCDLLVTNPSGIFIDCTLGGGGHSAEILSRLDSGGSIIAFDKDPAAIERCTERFKEELESDKPRIQLVNGCYSEAYSREEIKGKVSGILLDLGVSSHQLDTDSRGLSYRLDSGLDMRFGVQGESADEVLNTAKEEELEKVLRNYGEEPFSKAIARRIVEVRRVNSLKSTFDLRSIVADCVPPHLLFKSLSRVFQAFRIWINDELNVLESTLTNIIPFMEPNGNIVVLSYHSLEDRIVKNIFREYGERPKKVNKYVNDSKSLIDESKPLFLPYAKPILPDKQEIEFNPRARSAKLRVAVKK